MNNTEKARELATEYSTWVENCKTLEDYYTTSYMTMVGKCEKMANWKDEQFKEALNNILIECDACFDEQTTTTLQAIINHQKEIL